MNIVCDNLEKLHLEKKTPNFLQLQITLLTNLLDQTLKVTC